MRIAFFIFILGLMGCSQHTAMEQTTVVTFDLQGHRGCRGLMPENTIPAMLKALSLNVITLELDVVITADDEVILSHEPFFNHDITTKPNSEPVTEAEEKQLNIYKMSFAETQRYDVGMKPHPRFPEQQKMAATKPKLSQVFEAVKHWCDSAKKPVPFFNIETKTSPAGDNIFHPAPEKFVELLLAVIDAEKMSDRVIVQSFDFRTLQVLHNKRPQIKTAALVEKPGIHTASELVAAVGFKPTIFSPAYLLLNQALINSMHENGIAVIPWTVNETSAAASLKQMKVDGLITDYPDRIR